MQNHRYIDRPSYLNICDWLWQEQTVGLKIGFVHFSIKLRNNNFWLKHKKNYYSIFLGSRDMNFIRLIYSKVQFREKRFQSLLIQIEILSNACAFNLELWELLRQNVQIRPFLASWLHRISNDVLHVWMPNRLKANKI